MMNENQIEKFKQKLNTLDNFIERTISGENLVFSDKEKRIFQNIYYRYKYTVEEDYTKGNFLLPLEAFEIFNEYLEDKGITVDEFLNLKGNLNKFLDLCKTKHESNEKPVIDQTINSLEYYSSLTLEELNKKYDELSEKLNNKKRTHNTRFKNLYNMTDSEYNSIGLEINKLNKELVKIRDILNSKQKDSQVVEEEIVSFEKDESNSEFRIRKLLEEINNLNSIIDELNEKIKYERSLAEIDCVNKYKSNLEKEKSKYIEELKKLNEQLKSAIQDKKNLEEKIDSKDYSLKKMELDYKSLKGQLEKKESIINNYSRKSRKKYTSIIIDLLLNNEYITDDDIYYALESYNIDRDFVRNIMREIIEKIPGIKMSKSLTDKSYKYQLTNNSLDVLDDYLNSEASTSITNMQDGEFSFIVRADTHLKLTSKPANLKTCMDPYFEISAKFNNAPIVDLGDIAHTFNSIEESKLWVPTNTDLVRKNYDFFTNYSKSLSMSPKTKHYYLLGNHDEHPYLLGIDPIELFKEYSDNTNFVGFRSGGIKIADDKMGLFHDKKLWRNRSDDSEIINMIENDINEIASDYIYSLFGHYHIGYDAPIQGFSMVKNGIANPILFRVTIKDGKVDKMYANHLRYNNDKKCFSLDKYETEIYNRDVYELVRKINN